jgi:betaine-aldehyde dehydrogenase
MATATKTLRNLIDGAPVEFDGEHEAILNPATGEELALAPLSSAHEVDRAVRAARAAFPAWSQSTPAQRAAALLALADVIDEHADYLARLEALNAGKPLAAVLGDELPVMADNLRFFAGAARCLEGRAAGEYMEGHTSWVRREAVGVVGQITPWNYPLMMAIWKIGPALAAGCTIVLKPAETTPMTTVRFAEMAAEILPAGVLNVVMGHGTPTGEALITHPEVDMVSLTGSVDTGKHIARTAADSLKRVHLELGGKAPVLVFDDVSMQAAMETIAATGYYNAGQDCTAATRVLAADAIYDEVVSGLATQAQGLVVGDTLDPATTLGPINSARQRARVEGFLERKPAHAEVVAGGSEPDGPGFFLEPTVVAGLRQDDEMIQREIFGPVITVQRFPDEAQAIEWANATRYGLASSVWTRDIGRALRVSRALRFGCVWINDHIPLVSEMPHGGFKESGYGKDLSVYSLEDYTVVKHVMANLD